MIATTGSVHVELRDGEGWQWIAGTGLALVLLGTVAALNLVLATIVTLYVVAATLLVAGVAMTFHGLQGPRAAKAWAIVGLLYVAAAGFMLVRPAIATSLLTVWLASLMLFSGGMRIVLALGRRRAGRGWLALSGLFGLAAGSIVALGWPADAIWVPGLILSVDLLVHGAAFILMGLKMRGSRVF